ncbi:MAG: hypothetical protein ACHQ17_00405 [Polyangia bacterium]|jgi:hypothetical protein
MRRLGPIILMVLLGGCGSPGSVYFDIEAPSYAPLDPITDQVSEYAIKRFDGTLVGVASVNASSPTEIALGPLMQIPQPEDLVLNVLSGSDLLGMARIRDVTILNGVQADYVAAVRKPLITIGSALPIEQTPVKLLEGEQILDPNTGDDLSGAMDGPKLPMGTQATAATWDGRFLLAANATGMTLLDTGSGKLVGVVPLPFAPARLEVGARDSAVAALDPAGGVLLFTDVPGLEADPSHATGNRIPISGALRTLTFAPDGKSVYVLSGGDVDACSPTAAAPAPNAITAIGIDGTNQGTWTLPGFVADLTVDATGNRLVLAGATDNQIETLSVQAPFGAAKPDKLAAAICPSAVRVANGEVFAVTNEKAPIAVYTNAFILLHVPLAGGTVSKVPFGGPEYTSVDTSSKGTPDGDTNLNFVLTPASLVAYEMAITPDGSRLVFAIRARYHEKAAPLTVLQAACTADLDIAEYGVYLLDTRTGQSTYTRRSQLVSGTNGEATCIDCPLPPGPDITFNCMSKPGDRAAGLAAVFGGP